MIWIMEYILYRYIFAALKLSSVYHVTLLDAIRICQRVNTELISILASVVPNALR